MIRNAPLFEYDPSIASELSREQASSTKPVGEPKFEVLWLIRRWDEPFCDVYAPLHEGCTKGKKPTVHVGDDFVGERERFQVDHISPPFSSPKRCSVLLVIKDITSIDISLIEDADADPPLHVFDFFSDTPINRRLHCGFKRWFLFWGHVCFLSLSKTNRQTTASVRACRCTLVTDSLF